MKPPNNPTTFAEQQTVNTLVVNIVLFYLLSVSILIISPCYLQAQGFGLGTSSPSEILHLYRDQNTIAGDVAIRYQTQAAGTGPISTSPTSGVTFANDATVGTVAWTNPGNAITSGAGYATAATAGTTNYLKATNFGFAIPGGATINSITVEVEKSKTINAVAINDAWATANFTTDETPAVDDFTYTTTAGTDRILVFVAMQANDNNEARTLTSVTYDGVALTKAVGVQNSLTDDHTLEIWYLKDASINTGARNVRATWSGRLRDRRIYAMACYEYVDQTTSIAASDINTSASQVNSLQLQSALAVNEGDLIIASSCFENDLRVVSESSGTYAQKIDEDQADDVDVTLSVFDKAITADGGTEQPTISYDGGAEQMSIGAIVLNSSSGVTDNIVSLVHPVSGISGDNEADAVTNWANTDAYTSYTGTTDNLWGLGWTAAQINNAAFGVVISATVGQHTTANIDHIRITINYQAAPVSYTEFTTGIDITTGEWKIAESSALGTSDVMKITGGNICYTGSLAACSDIRFKKDFGTIQNPLNKVLQLKGLTYYWKIKEFPDKNFTKEKQIGLIAQDVEKLFPEMVQTDALGYKSIDYSRLTAVLIEAIKEQQQQIEILKKDNQSLKQKATQYNELEAKVNSLETVLKELQLIYRTSK